MTLLLKVSPTTDSVVFVGDKRLTDANGFGDEYQKATPLGANSVGGACGSTRSLHPATLAVQRDVHQQLAEFFSAREVNDESTAAFCDELRSRHDRFLEEHRGGKPLDYDGYLFTVFMASRGEGRILERVLRATVSKQDGLQVARQTFICKTGGLLMFGDQPIINAVVSTNHPALQHLYKQPHLLDLIRRPKDTPFNIVSVNEAVDICRLVVAECSAAAEKITGNGSTISPDCDVFVIDGNGVRVA